MNVNYLTQTQTFTIPHTQQKLYGTQDPSAALYGTQDPSPVDSMSPTPSNVSPTSPRLPNYMTANPHRQLRPHKVPLYVPAVLRPTEFPPKQSPMTPPKSLHGSLDSLQSGDIDATLAAAREHFDMAMEPDWIEDEDDLGEVTGPPNKDHWKPDEASPTCDSPKCRLSFNIFIRKHHCRHCGHIFCADHTAYTILLNQDARFHPDGIPSRACDTCHRQFLRWDTARSLRRKDSNETENGQHSSSGTPMGPPSHRRMISGHQQAPEQAANSVPRDWAWSTF